MVPCSSTQPEKGKSAGLGVMPPTGFDDKSGVERDLLPLPSGPGLLHFLHGVWAMPCGRTRSAQKRRSIFSRQVQMVSAAVGALNSLGGRGRSRCPAARVSAVQAWALGNIASSVRDLGPPPADLSPAGAFSMLRGCGGIAYTDSGASAGDFAIYQPGQVALPLVGAQAVDLSSCLPPDLQSLLVNPNSGMKLGPDEVDQAVLDKLGAPAVDPSFKSSPRMYARFITEALDAGILEASSDVVQEVGIFLSRRRTEC